MFFSDKEKEVMENLFLAIAANKDDSYILSFASGDVIEARVNTCYETDNGFDENDADFEEYHACAMEVIRVIHNRSQTFKAGSLFELNYHNYPQKIVNSKDVSRLS